MYRKLTFLFISVCVSCLFSVAQKEVSLHELTEMNGKKMMQLFKNISTYYPKNGNETKKYVNE
ncbi:MAG TPA: hypothetical protein EYQ86_05245, partial [Bacteroidetes bacterium]|nr:hypothetical protein [Bacteroidota bacterium]